MSAQKFDVFERVMVKFDVFERVMVMKRPYLDETYGTDLHRAFDVTEEEYIAKAQVKKDSVRVLIRTFPDRNGEA